MTYREIAKACLCDPVQQAFCPTGSVMSTLCLGRVGEQTTDCYLTYEKNAEGLYQLRCLVRSALVEGRPVLVEARPLEQTFADPDTDPHDPETVAAYLELYPQVRAFAFAPALPSDRQTAQLRDFMAAWQRLLTPAWRGVLQQHFPEFFAWAKPFL